MRAAFRVLHRYLSLAAVALWSLQAVTGVMLVFHWELDDWSVAGSARPLQPAAFSQALDGMLAARPGDVLDGVYPSGGDRGRFDVLLDRPDGKTDVLRVDGQGQVLRQRPWNYDKPHLGLFQIATYLHQTLFAHQPGRWLIGLSGLLLLSNLCMGLVLAWPRAGQWGRLLMPPKAPRAAMAVHGWHRAAGLWLAAPAALLVLAGVVMAFDVPLQALFDARATPGTASAAAEPLAVHPIGAGQVIATALTRYPGASLAALEPPGPGAPWWSVKVRQAGEWRRVQGTTTLYVSSRSGRILADYDALKAPMRTRVWDSLYALHTGEAGGLAGRWIVELIGLWLTGMCALGLSLWWLRRRLRRSRKDVA